MTLRLVAVAFVVGLAGCARGEPEQTPEPEQAPEPLLRAEALTDIDALRAAQARVSAAHIRVAHTLDASGESSMHERRYAAASKAYGEAALYEPTPERLILYAVAYARTPRPRDSVDEARAAERAARDHAIEVLAAAGALAAEGSPARREAIDVRTCFVAASDSVEAARCGPRESMQ